MAFNPSAWSLILTFEYLEHLKYLQLIEKFVPFDLWTALASTSTLPDQTQVIICQKWVVLLPVKDGIEEIRLEHLAIIYKVEKENWRKFIIDYLSMAYGILFENPRRSEEQKSVLVHPLPWLQKYFV